MSGKVYLLGAGPGSMDYLTVRGQRLLRQADVLVYDALVDLRLLSQLSPGCRVLSVGKRGGQPSTPQAEINQLLVDLCLQGQQVVRLKSGDPFVFGRATSEVQALRQAGCSFEVIPGISSALAAPLLSAIPLTDPVLSHGFGVFSAHSLTDLDWASLAQIETLVLLMGGRNLAAICHQLTTHGRLGQTPVAVIRWAGQPQQRLWVGTLLDIAQRTKGEELSPCIIVVGEVVSLRQFMLPGPAATLPLAAKTVLVTRAVEQSSMFSQLLGQQGATVVEMPALEIRPPSQWSELDRAVEDLAKTDWLVLTSANAVSFFLDRLIEIGYDLRQLTPVRIAVVGKKTARVLQERGLRADFIPPDYVADSLVETFPDPLMGKRVLFPRVETGGRDVLVKAFQAQGAAVAEVAAYESACPTAMPAAAALVLEQGQADVVTFASSKTVRHFSQLMARRFGAQWLDLLRGVEIASIGPQTTKACQQQLGRVDIEAQQYTLEGLTEALVQWATA